jgi:hypothetical protein
MQQPNENEIAFMNLLNSLDVFELALLRERILKIIEITEEDMKQNPQVWENSFISKHIINSLIEKTNTHLGFDKRAILN